MLKIDLEKCEPEYFSLDEYACNKPAKRWYLVDDNGSVGPGEGIYVVGRCLDHTLDQYKNVKRITKKEALVWQVLNS